MRISSINNCLYRQNFSAEYRTEDVLRLITFYPYKNKDAREIIQNLTSVDIYSREFTSSFPENYFYGIAIAAYSMLCSEKVLEQRKELKEADDTFDAALHLREGRKQTDNWFKTQIKKLGKTMEIKPFTISDDEFEKKYKFLVDLCDKI